jgi:sulfite exporter TauE/SafE
MLDVNLVIIISLAFGMGMLHALDADHIAMVTSMSASQHGMRNSLRYCLRWALGHALTLIVVGILVFAAGMQLPQQLSVYAEITIAVFLMVMGVLLLRQLRQQNIHIHYHQHDDLPQHAHWHSHESERTHQHQHRALFIGSLHGLAGSAPLLALIPLAVNQQPLAGILYLVVFSVGVITAMLLFGGALRMVSAFLYRRQQRIMLGFRLAISLATITVGALLMLQAVR